MSKLRFEDKWEFLDQYEKEDEVLKTTYIHQKVLNNKL